MRHVGQGKEFHSSVRGFEVEFFMKGLGCFCHAMSTLP